MDLGTGKNSSAASGLTTSPTADENSRYRVELPVIPSLIRIPLEWVTDAQLEVGTVAIHRILTLVLVHHTIVVTNGDRKGADAEANATAEVDVHAIEVIVVIVVIGLAAARTADVAVKLHRGSQAIL